MRKLLFILFILLSFTSYAQVKVVAPIIRNDPADTYPTGYDTLLNGGAQSVGSIALRNAIYPESRKEGMIVYVRDIDSFFVLKDCLLDACWTNIKNIIGGGGGIDTTVADAKYFKEEGNSFGLAARLGTNDNQPLYFETNNTDRGALVGNTWLFGGTTPSGNPNAGVVQIFGNASLSGRFYVTGSGGISNAMSTANAFAQPSDAGWVFSRQVDDAGRLMTLRNLSALSTGDFLTCYGVDTALKLAYINRQGRIHANMGNSDEWNNAYRKTDTALRATRVGNQLNITLTKRDSTSLTASVTLPDTSLYQSKILYGDTAQVRYILITMGQSNDVGFAETARLANTQYNYKGIAAGYPSVRTSQGQYTSTPNTRIRIWGPANVGSFAIYQPGINSSSSSNGKFGPELAFATRLFDATGKNIEIIKCAFSGTALSSGIATQPPGTWNDTGRLIAIRDYIIPALNNIRSTYPGAKLKIMVQWYQGETDAGEVNPASIRTTYRQQFQIFKRYIDSAIYTNFQVDSFKWALTQIDFNTTSRDDSLNLALQDIAASNPRTFYMTARQYPRKANLTVSEASPIAVGNPNSVGGSDDAHSSYIRQLAVGEKTADIFLPDTVNINTLVKEGDYVHSQINNFLYRYLNGYWQVVAAPTASNVLTSNDTSSNGQLVTKTLINNRTWMKGLTPGNTSSNDSIGKSSGAGVLGFYNQNLIFDITTANMRMYGAIQNSANANNASISLPTSGMLVRRNQTTGVALTVENQNASATANIQEWKINNTVRASISPEGYQTTANTVAYSTGGYAPLVRNTTSGRHETIPNGIVGMYSTSTVTGNTTFALAANQRLDAIDITPTTTGTVDIGTTAGGNDIASAISVTAGQTKSLNISRKLSRAVSSTVYITPTSTGSTTYDFYYR